MPNDRKLCLVLGGSFNPPTLAHRDLLLGAMSQMEKLENRKTAGLLVPSSDAYVSRKMSKDRSPSAHAFPEAMRLDMLLELQTDTCLSSTDVEFGDDGRGHTYQMLVKVRNEDPSMDYALVVGADKLGIIPWWHDAEKLLSEFRLVVAARGMPKSAAVQKIRSNPFLSRHIGNITVLDRLPGQRADASSSAAREAWHMGDYDRLAALCGFGVTAMLSRYSAMGRCYDGREAYKKWRQCR